MNNENNVESVLYAVGTRGYSAYEVAVQNGFVGTEQEWLDSLVGPTGEMGPEGKSAYEIAVENGYEGSEEDWVNAFLTPDGYYNKSVTDEKLAMKVNTSDIVNNLSSSDVNKVLSAAQGKSLKDTVLNNKNEADDNFEAIYESLANKMDEASAVSNFATKAEVQNVANGSPLPASSTGEMTDTDKIYVNTSDGKWYYYDGDSWEIGGVYQASQIPLGSIDSSYLQNETITPKKLQGHSVLNLFNPDDPDVLVNKRMYMYNGNMVYDTYNDFCVSGYMAVLPGEKIYVRMTTPYNVSAIGYFDKDKNGLSTDKSGNSGWNRLGLITIPAGVYYIRTMFAKNARYTEIGVYTSEEEPPSYIPFNKYTLDGLYINEANIIPQNPTSNIYTLKKDGTGDYADLRTALEAFSGTATEKILEIYPGTYNVLDDYTTEEINAASYSAGDINSFCGPAVKGRITLRGVGNREEIILNGSLDSDTYTAYIRGQISTLNLSGNITLENITVKAENIRYAIHDDFNANSNTTINIINCVLEGGIRYDGSGLSHAYGMGTRSGKITNFENCYLIPNFYEHTNYSFSKPSVTTLKNCTCARNITVQDMGSGKKDKLYIISCNAQCISYLWYNNVRQVSDVQIFCDNDIPIFYDHTANFVNEQIIGIYNDSNAIIEKGSMLKRIDKYSFAPMEASDQISMFYGVALDEIEQGGYGRVLKKGQVLATDLGVTSPAVGTKYTVRQGEFTGTVEDDYIAVCEISNYIKFI